MHSVLLSGSHSYILMVTKCLFGPQKLKNSPASLWTAGKKCIKSSNTGAGWNEDATASEFSKIQQEKRRPKSLGFGTLIFDETKVQSKLLFDINGGTVKGHLSWCQRNFLSFRPLLSLCTPPEISRLRTFYGSFGEIWHPQAASLVQTSMQEILGPQLFLWLRYGDYEAIHSWQVQDLSSCLWWSLQQFGPTKGARGYKACANCQLKKKVLVCRDIIQRREFSNPYDPEDDNKLFMMICPDYQVSNTQCICSFLLVCTKKECTCAV